eukprot:TRINITY_DN11462_c0_g1_i2.p1 TRINITY_DN11462_c0_g1~~TRINITY_DN11462_c0_g1_i2.p1  ORF type:complete len:319 (+),score=33.89 TRINITY_DN11462_c0_g1_i2:40-957(+)
MARMERKLAALERQLRTEMDEQQRQLQDDLAAVWKRFDDISLLLDAGSLSKKEAAKPVTYDAHFDAVLPGGVQDSYEDDGDSGRAQRARDVVLSGRLCSISPVDVRPAAVETNEAFRPRQSVYQAVSSFFNRGRDLAYREPVPQEDTVWSIVLVQKTPSITMLDLLIGLALVLKVTFFQVYFQIMCESPAFQGTKNDALKQAASEWRSTYAHAFENANSAWVSLASRVCNNDGSLIVSTEHRDLLLDINNYLGLGSDAFEPSTMSPGTVLCLLCTSLWIWTILTSAMELADRVVAVFQLPRATVT